MIILAIRTKFTLEPHPVEVKHFFWFEVKLVKETPSCCRSFPVFLPDVLTLLLDLLHLMSEEKETVGCFKTEVKFVKPGLSVEATLLAMINFSFSQGGAG